MAAPTRIRISRPFGWIDEGMVCVVAPDTTLHGEYVDAQSFGVAETALQAAYMGLRSAENQFAAMRESQEAGHFPEVHNNPEKFAEKADAAARALAELGLPTSPAPASHDLAEVRRTAPGTGGGHCGTCGDTGWVENGLSRKRCFNCSGRPTETSRPCSHLWHEYDKNCAGCNPAANASSCGPGTAQAEGENDEPAEDTPAGAPVADAGDGSTPPRDGASAGSNHMLPASACPSWAQGFLPQSARRDRG